MGLAQINLTLLTNKGFTPLDVTWNENTRKYSVSMVYVPTSCILNFFFFFLFGLIILFPLMQLMNVCVSLHLFLCEA
jgi:hypothetical protein